MALVSPGVEVTIVDESNYPAASTSTVPYILVATAENKVNPAGTAVASGTLASTANDTFLISSQRELVNTFGNPFFYKTSGGTPLNGYELNEYGLQAAYSVLGISNRVYVQRVDIDLAELTASTTRPTGDPADGTFWLDTGNTSWGLFEWNQTTEAFTNKVPTVITEVSDLVGGVSTGIPLTSIGAIGDYVVNTTHSNTPTYYKNRNNVWVLIGNDNDSTDPADVDWYDSWPAATSVASPTLSVGDTLTLNGTAVGPLVAATVSELVGFINAATITGITAAEVSSKLEIYVDNTALLDKVVLSDTGTLLSDLAITAGDYFAPKLQQSAHTNNPQWRLTDTEPHPTGSIWIKTTNVNLGANLVVKRYDVATATFVQQSAPIYENDQSANNALNSSAGGATIALNDTYAQYDTLEDDTATLKVFKRSATGATDVTGATADFVATPFAGTETFSISASVAGSDTLSAPVTTLALGGTDAAAFVTAFTAAGVANTTAGVTSTGAIKITHTQGGVIVIDDVVGTGLSIAGFTSSLINVRNGNATDLILSNWEILASSAAGYSTGSTPPGQDPIQGTKWYYSAVDEIDIMIHDGTGWKGYQTVASDIRGYNLSLTDPAGPLVSASEPTAQSDGTVLAFGDIWVDTSDLESYPNIYRYESAVNSSSGVIGFNLIDSADQTTEDGILFADARWDSDGTVDPVSGNIPTIASLLTSNYLDLDAPDENLYPTGTLLFNTRRSGYNVKEFRLNYFNATNFSGVLPAETNSWVTVSGLKNDGSPFMGRLAQRAIVVQALKAGMDANTEIREEERRFNLIATPGYPELIPNMVALNNERNNTAFVIGDSPLRLPQSGSELFEWATNNSGLGTSTGDGLSANDEYLGVFYPSGQTNDLTGSAVVVPPSHMMLRTMVHSDDISYPWFAPAGPRRGGIDNVNALGYIDAQEGEFRQIATRQGVRDTLYENNVNPLTFIPGTGLVNFGNKTTVSGTALDRINVARLVAYLRTVIESVAKTYLFEPNDKITRDDIKASIEGILNDVMSKRGIFDYLVVCDESNNTPSRIDRSELYVDVAIEPVKAVEFIFIPVRIQNTGEIGGGN